MDIDETKLKKYFLTAGISIVVVTVIVNLLINFFQPNQNMKELKELLNKAEEKIDQSLEQVNTARTRINEIDTSLTNFREELFLSQQRVDSIDSIRNVRQKNFRARTDGKLDEIAKLQTGIDLSNNNLSDIPMETLKPDEQ